MLRSFLRLFPPILLLFLLRGMDAADWPTYMHDNRRSGITTENLPDRLYLHWQYSARNAPLPAWPEPAETDYWHREANLKPRVIYDKAFHVVSGGNKIYFASTSDDKLYCHRGTNQTCPNLVE